VPQRKPRSARRAPPRRAAGSTPLTPLSRARSKRPPPPPRARGARGGGCASKLTLRPSAMAAGTPTGVLRLSARLAAVATNDPTTTSRTTTLVATTTEKATVTAMATTARTTM